MKHSNIVKLSFLVAILAIHSSLAAELSSKKLEEATEAKCEDSCQGK